MQQRMLWVLLLFIILGTGSCKTLFPKHTVTATDDGKLEAVFVQVNDVYEIAPLANGKLGGMARVATVKKQYKKANNNTFLVMAGDFLSPSVYNSLKYQGNAIRGKQMVEAMNAAGFDLVTFGNHEFDIKETELQDRINESGFQWISSNCLHVAGGTSSAFQKQVNGSVESFPQTFILSLKDADGSTAKIGFIGLTLPFNKADYVGYTDPLSTAKQLYATLKDSCDAVVAITHQSIDDDKKLAAEIPGLAAILGGHEHDMRFEKVGNIYITKAHANAKSAYIVKLLIDKKNKKVSSSAQLKTLDESVMPDSATNIVVKKWIAIADSSYATIGFDSKQIIIENGEPLDGRETEVRSKQTSLTKLIVEAMSDACPQADAALMNAGSVRVDDVLYPPITQYDIIRALPFGGPVREVDMKGSLLLQTLEAGHKNRGIGGFLQFSKVSFNEISGAWTIGNAAILPEKIYRVALSDFLLTGKEANLDFLNPQNPDMLKVYEPVTSTGDGRSDIRLAVVKYLQKKAIKN
jgi:2',3'-cyclic-nucleotide 2'-phosphodiesterase (5'-nucleotidase family)